MEIIKTYYNDNGKIVSASTNLATKQFYADNLAVMGPLEVVGAVPEAFDYPASLTIHLPVDSYEDGTWLDETGGGNSLVAETS